MNDSLVDYYEENTFRQILQIDLKEKSKKNVIEVIEQLQTMEGVVYAGPDYIVPVADLHPSDPYYMEGRQWGLNGDYGIDIESAWDTTTGSQEVTVGVIDTGISFHEELYTKFSIGYDFYNENNITTDDEDHHGTHVAGIIAATSNAKGVVGVAPAIKLSALQVSHWDAEEQDYYIYTSDVLEAISFASGLWGTPYQISVLNYSVSGFGTNTSLLYSISQFPGVFVWSAGNERENVDLNTNIDGFDLPNLISVGALSSSGVKADFSNYGNNVNIYAPGAGIWSTIPTNNYANMSGTSMAAPFVSGVAALLLSDNPGLTAEEVKEAILQGAEDNQILGNNGVQYQSLRLSASGAMQYAQQNYDVIPAPLRLSVSGKTDGVWSINLRNPNNYSVTVAYNSKMCFGDDAKSFSGLSDVVWTTIGAKSSKKVSISENFLAGWITTSIEYTVGGQRYRVISCAHGLDEGSATFRYYVVHNTILI